MVSFISFPGIALTDSQQEAELNRFILSVLVYISFNMILCEVCMAVFSYRGSDRYGYNNQIGGHHADTVSLIEAASNGCKICTYIQQCTLKRLGTLEQVEMRLRIAEVVVDLSGQEEMVWAHWENGLTVHGINGRPKMEDCFYFTVMAVARSMVPINIDAGKRQPEADRPMSNVANTAKAFNSHCLRQHPQCAARATPAKIEYPTRLLELGESTARIIRPATDGALGPYVALSYCWGPNPSFLQLTEWNQDELHSGVSLDRLPIAFREAIELVKSLGYKYIWIDCLCILQNGEGSEADWRSESARMGDVYSNCILNLSLSRNSSPESTCLGGPGLHALLPPFSVKIGNESFIMFLSDYYIYAKVQQPLGLRAWTFQERVLAPRILSLGQGELFWDCLELQGASESFPQGLTPRLSKRLGLKKLEFNIPSMQLPAHDFYTNWLRILDNYTPRHLTYMEKDKLIALGAVATRICHAQRDVYIAGHFQSTLPYSLLWRLHNTNDGDKWSSTTGRRVTSAAMTTPSWSWASIDGPVRHYFGSQPLAAGGWPEMMAVVLEAPTVQLADPSNPFGQCKFASITISTVCTDIVWSEDISEWQLADKTKTLENLNGWEDVVLIVWLDDPDQQDRMVDGSLFTLAAFCDGYVMGDHGNQSIPGRQGLVLQECRKGNDNVYKRVAHFRLGVRERPDTGQTLADFEKAQIRRGWKEVKEVFESENRTLVLI